VFGGCGICLKANCFEQLKRYYFRESQDSEVKKMADCECLPKCPFFNDKMQGVPAMISILKNKYCRGDNSICARYMVFKALGRERVPADLFPNQVERAQGLISGTLL